MKKAVLALAVLGAFAGSASAQTSVTIYGVVDAAVAHEDKGAALSAAKPGGSKSFLASGGYNGSRLGFKGSEDLGGGLSAIFTLENGFNSDDGTLGQGGRLFGRQAWVGLQGGFGTLKLGRQNTPVRDTLSAINPFDFGDLSGNLEKVWADNGGGFRVDNSVTYTTPSNLGGFFAQGLYGFGEVVNNSKASRQTGLATGYANGPAYAALAYHRINGDVATGGNSHSTVLGGTYDFTAVKAHLGFGWNKAANLAGTTTGDSRELLAGITVPFGSNAFLASYFRHKDQLVANADYKRFALGYNYSFSKRTAFYASWSRLANQSASTKLVDKSGEDYSIYGVGIRHKF